MSDSTKLTGSTVPTEIQDDLSPRVSGERPQLPGTAMLTFLILLSGFAMAGALQDQYRSTAEGVFTEEQAKRGQRIQRKVCLQCHIRDYYTGGLLDSWEGNTVGALNSLIMNTMPEDRPSSLSLEEYTDLMAYILQINGFPTGKDELPADKAALARIIIERKNK